MEIVPQKEIFGWTCNSLMQHSHHEGPDPSIYTIASSSIIYTTYFNLSACCLLPLIILSGNYLGKVQSLSF